MQDGASSHTARGTITEMQNRGLHLLGHPASSPDLNLAEHPIGKIKYNLMNRQERRPTNERELRAAIEWEWAVYSEGTLTLRGLPPMFESRQRRSNSMLASQNDS